MNEEWKDIRGYEGLYKVNRRGEILSMPKRGGYRKPTILKQKIDSHGYCNVDLFKGGNGSRKKVHRLVADAFISNPKLKKTVNHIDGNPKNNHADNLEWATQLENNLHAIYVLKNRFKPVKRIDPLSGETRIFESITEAAKAVGAEKTNIVKACRGKTKTCAGFVWQYIG